MDQRTNRLITQNAARQVAKAENLYIAKKASSWSELAYILGVTIDSAYTCMPFNYSGIRAWGNVWKQTAAARAEGENLRIITAADKKPKLKVAADTETFGKITLFPEQQSVYEECKRIFWKDKTSNIVIQDGDTGSGKTFVAAALCHHIIANKLWRTPEMPFDLPYRILINTPNSVIEQFKRVLEDFGLGEYIGTLIMVTSYSQMVSSFGKLFYTEEYDPYAEDPDEPRLKLNELTKPYAYIADEFHRLGNRETKQSKFALALADSPNPPRILAMSATPWVTVDNSRFAVIASRRRYFGMLVKGDNFNLFAKNICKEPNKPNIEAAKRLRAQLSDIIVSFPYVKWKAKAVNQVLIVDFAKDSHRKAVEDAFEVYLEAKRKAGENTKFGRFEEAVALGQYRKATEPFRIPAIVERTMDDIKNGYACIISGSFRKTIADGVTQLIAAGLKRNQISVIWGGKRQWNKKLLLSEDEREELLMRALRGEMLDPYEIRRLQETMNFQSERLIAGETPEEQEARILAQLDLNLYGTQSAKQRQEEIDRYQSGEALVALFTLPAGNVGLSLDQCRPDLRPRRGYHAPCYIGSDAKQALGRGLRRATVSDVYQWMCFMRGTVEEYHVAPRMDIKLKCIAAVTGSAFSIVDLDTAPRTSHKYRTAEQAVLDAEAPESQLYSYDDADYADGDTDDADANK